MSQLIPVPQSPPTVFPVSWLAGRSEGAEPRCVLYLCDTLVGVRLTELLWDQDNEAHIARHAVTPAEVEDVVFAPSTRWEVQTSHWRPRLVALGPTREGRLVFVVCEMPGSTGASVCVTARPATDREQRFYQVRT